MEKKKGLKTAEKEVAYFIKSSDLPTGNFLSNCWWVCQLKSTGALEGIYSSLEASKFFGSLTMGYYSEEMGYFSKNMDNYTYLHPSFHRHYNEYYGIFEISETYFLQELSPLFSVLYLVINITNRSELKQKVLCVAHFDPCSSENLLENGSSVLVVKSRNKELTAIIGATKPSEFIYLETQDSSNLLEACNSNEGLKIELELNPKSFQSFAVFILLARTKKEEALKKLKSLPDYNQSFLEITRQDRLRSAKIITPDTVINRGVFWSKVNLLKQEAEFKRGFGIIDGVEPSSVAAGDELAWYTQGADYLNPSFTEKALLSYLKFQRENGSFPAWADFNSGECAVESEEINEATLLLIIAFWHHFQLTGSQDFLKEIYPVLFKSGKLINSLLEKDDYGLLRGAGWRQLRVNGYLTETNVKAYFALCCLSDLAESFNLTSAYELFSQSAENLKASINRHLFLEKKGFYCLYLDLNGKPNYCLTADAVFPVVFGVSGESVIKKVIEKLNNYNFWCEAGLRTVSLESLDYHPYKEEGKRGGIWSRMTAWYAYAATFHRPDLAVYILHKLYSHYFDKAYKLHNPPAYFVRWFNSETLVNLENKGCLVTPSLYLWVLLEGICSLRFGAELSINVKLPDRWKWFCVKELPYKDHKISFFAIEKKDAVQLYANYSFKTEQPFCYFDTDITDNIECINENICFLGFSHLGETLIFAGNTSSENCKANLFINSFIGSSEEYRVDIYYSESREWVGHGVKEGDAFSVISLKLEEEGFAIIRARVASFSSSHQVFKQLLTEMSESDLNLLHQISTEVHYPTGSIIFRENEYGDTFYIIKTGKIRIYKIDRMGRENTLAILRRSDVFGEMAVIEDYPRVASAQVVEDADLLEIKKDQFYNLLKASPEIATELIRILSKRLREVDRQLVD